MKELNSMGEVYFALCKSIDTPVSLGAWLRFKYSHLELANMQIVPSSYMSAESFASDYAVVSFLSKWKGLDTGLDLKAEAVRKFTQSEEVCAETNRRIKTFLTGAYDPWLHQVHHEMQRKISRLLGPFSTFCIDHAYGWGPGATLELPRRRAFVDTKMCETPITVSATALPLLGEAMRSDHHWLEVLRHATGPLFEVTDCCRIDTVPKNAKTDRVIAVEPRGNGFLQKGIGRYFRDQLRTVGVDLDNQGRNQYLASQAEVLNLSTLDLKAASDSVSKELVWALFPYDWACAMDDTRSKRAVMPDKTTVKTLEKFSSMGNGFTFELETLIFWSLCQVIKELNGSRGEVSVYGDDLIVPRSIASQVCIALQFFGFSVNDDKSFFDGPFFESCGKHYFHGIDVTPAYQKEVVGSPIGAIRLGNRLIRLAFRLKRQLALDMRLHAPWSAARRLFPASVGYRLPFGAEGDDGWLLPYTSWPWPSEWTSKSVSDMLNHGLRCPVLKPKAEKFPANDSALLAWTLRRDARFTDPQDPEYQCVSVERGHNLPQPYLGEVSRDKKEAQLLSSSRRVIPDGRFSAIWA